MMIVLAGLSGLVVGCLLTVCFFLIAKRGEEKAREAWWRENRAQLQEQYEAQLKEQLQRQKALLLREQERKLRELRASRAGESGSGLHAAAPPHPGAEAAI